MPLRNEAVDALAEKFGRFVATLARAQFAAMVARIAAGEDAAAAVRAAQAGFTGAMADQLAQAFSEILQRSVGVAEMRALPVGDITLSRRLYQHDAQTQAEVLGVIRAHATGVHQARELALALYDGYNPRDGIKRPLEGRAVGQLPKALRALIEDATARRSLAKLVQNGQAQAARLKSAPLRAAYSEAIAAWESGAGHEALVHRLDIAQREKNRYFANRIAQTELARAHQAGVAAEFMADPEISVVQVLINPAHPKMDICDLHARADLYGLGPGLYPKAKAPQPPFHPFCWCKLRSRPSLDAGNARAVPGAAAAYLRGMPIKSAARVMGSEKRAQDVLGGASVDAVVNAGVDPLYRLARLGDIPLQRRQRLGLVQQAAPPEPQQPARFTPSATSREAGEWAVRSGLVDRADYTGVKPEVANAFNQSLWHHVTEFPALRRAQQFIGTGQAQFAAWRETEISRITADLAAKNPAVDAGTIQAAAKMFVKPLKVRARTVAHSWTRQGFSGVAVNRTYGADADGLRAIIEKNVETGFHPLGCASIKAVVDHEFGHQLDALLSLGEDAEVKRLFASAKAAGITESVSTYAGKNLAEFIAECWSEALNNPQPREFARLVAAIIRSRYADQF